MCYSIFKTQRLGTSYKPSEKNPFLFLYIKLLQSVSLMIITFRSSGKNISSIHYIKLLQNVLICAYTNINNKPTPTYFFLDFLGKNILSLFFFI